MEDDNTKKRGKKKKYPEYPFNYATEWERQMWIRLFKKLEKAGLEHIPPKLHNSDYMDFHRKENARRKKYEEIWERRRNCRPAKRRRGWTKPGG